MTGYERDQRFIVGHYQPASLIDLALSRGLDSHRLLRGCEVFYEDIRRGSALLSPEQFLRLIDNTQRLLGADDSSFLFGQSLLPGHFGDASQTLLHARDLFQALEQLCEFQALLSPLLAPRLLVEAQHIHLYWLDSCGAGSALPFLSETCLTAVVAMARKMGGERLPWKIQCAYPQPRHIEQYWVHLGDDIRFDAQVTLLSLPREYAHRPWPGATATAGHVARQACTDHLCRLGWQSSFLDRLYDHLRDHIRQPLNLERVAAAFAMSPASLKRKLHRHGTHFQQQLDQVRRHVALYLYQVKGYTNDEVRSYLGFSDTTNFRRSFKRWTGLTPSALAQWFGP